MKKEITHDTKVTYKLPGYLKLALLAALKKEGESQSRWFRQVARDTVKKAGINLE